MKKVFFLLTSLLILITISCSPDDEILSEQEVNGTELQNETQAQAVDPAKACPPSNPNCS